MKYDIELVGKVGSMALVDKAYRDIDYNAIARISRALTPGMLWVTSGAVEIGRVDFLKRNGFELADDACAKTDYSSQGQAILINTYRQYIDSRYSVRQILVEHQHFNDEIKRTHLREMLLRCPAQNAIPIINYNDAVSDEETRKFEIESLEKSLGTRVVHGLDNDETASQIACLVKAKTLLILSTLDGIFEDEKCTRLVPLIGGSSVDEVLANIEEHQKHCVGASRKGAYGAKAKLEYIKEPIKYGARVIIGSSRYSIPEILAGTAPRTVVEVK